MNDSTFVLEGHQDDRPVNLLQVTDTHLFARPDKSLLGVNTWDSFGAVVDQIAGQRCAIDLAVVTGDLSQDDSAESYRRFAERFASLALPTFWVPGNHDDLGLMRAQLRPPTLHSARKILTPHWQILLLDSHVPEHTYGFLAESQLAFVEQAIKQHPQHHTVLMMHHNLVPMGSEWLDQHRIKNGEAVQAWLSDWPTIKAVVWGHVHQAFDQVQQGIRMLATPSTCVQFLPASKHFALDTEAPGYRYLSLHADGTLETVVQRLHHNPFLPKMNSSGY